MSVSPVIHRLALVAAILSLTGLAACATPSNPAMMTFAATPDLTAGEGDIGYRSVTTVTVTGGKETNPLWTAQVSSEAFRTALQQSLLSAGYMGTTGKPMSVSADLVNLRQPMAGFDLSVTSEVRYTVVQDGRTLFNETVAATGTASMGEAFVAVERLRIANEKSIQANIREFLTRFRRDVR